MEKYYFREKELKSFVESIINEKHTVSSAMKSAKQYKKKVSGDQYTIRIDDLSPKMLLEKGFLKKEEDEDAISKAEEKYLDYLCDAIKPFCGIVELYQNFTGGGWNGEVNLCDEDYLDLIDFLEEKFPEANIEID
jgi:hypothetical protein